jgi:hypothetical protein
MKKHSLGVAGARRRRGIFAFRVKERFLALLLGVAIEA